MKKTIVSLLSFLLALPFLVGQNSFAQKDSTVNPPQKAVVAPASDEELILDEPAAAPKNKKEPSAPVQAQVPAKSIESPAAPIADSIASLKTAGKSAVDSTVKKSEPVPSTAPKKTAAMGMDSTAATVDEELILEGGAEDLLDHVKAAPAKSAAAKQGTAPGDSAKTAVLQDSIKTPVSADSAGMAAQVKPDSGATAAAVTLPKPKALADNTKIEKVRSINFAANLKEYRSPKLAMLMSLILPGSGQVYAKSNWVAAGFLAVEAAVFGVGYAFISKGQRQKHDAHKYADSHFDTLKYKQYYADLENNLKKNFDEEKAKSILIDSIFRSDSTGAQTLLDDMRSKNGSYYDNLLDTLTIFVRGWKDVEPEFTAEDGFKNIDTTKFQITSEATPYYVSRKGTDKIGFGFSQYQLNYIGMINDSRASARIGKNFYMSLLVNHIASAVIAGILAKKHNDALLGEESFWQRIDVEELAVNTGSHTVNGYALGIRF
jgi:hypothetical protein